MATTRTLAHPGRPYVLSPGIEHYMFSTGCRLLFATAHKILTTFSILATDFIQNPATGSCTNRKNRHKPAFSIGALARNRTWIVGTANRNSIH